MPYIWENPLWPSFSIAYEELSLQLGKVHASHGKLLGFMESILLVDRQLSSVEHLSDEIQKSSEIEGEIFSRESVRSSVGHRFGFEYGSLDSKNRRLEGVVDMVLDAVHNCNAPLSQERLFNWHAGVFPTGRSGINRITVGGWRTDETGRMRVISGSKGKEKFHFEAPPASRIKREMDDFIRWFNDSNSEPQDLLLKSGIAHLWFVTIHPFDDGNGRIARALTDMLLSRADKTAERFYSLSVHIRKFRKEYYSILEDTQCGKKSITTWLMWFLHLVESAITETNTEIELLKDRTRFWERAQGCNCVNVRKTLPEEIFQLLLPVVF